MINFLIFFATFTILIYWWIKRTFNYWTALGIPQIDVKFPSGLVSKERTFVYSFQSTYDKYKGKSSYVGTYMLIKPLLMVIDEDVIKQMLVKDFQYFQSRGMYHNERDDPLTANLFFTDNPRWRLLRTKLTPTFTSGKIKMMCPIVVEICERFKDIMDKKIDNHEHGIDMREMFSRFTIDVIGSIAFGLDCNCLNIPDSEFRREGMKTFNSPRCGMVKLFMMLAWPDLCRKLRFKSVRDDVTNFFMRITRENMEHRIKNNIKRNDFLDLLIGLYNDAKSNDAGDAHTEGLSMHEIAAQTFIFFIAGFETSSSAASFTIFELAKNQVIQDKLRTHIRDVLQRHDNKLTYEALKDMTYLEQCINEGMRRYSPLPLLTRRATQSYKLPNTDVIIPKDTYIGIPVYAIQTDPRNYADPLKYDPGRFAPEEIAKRHSLSFLAFGDGQRNCIGERFGMLQSKIAVSTMIGNYRFKLNPKTPTTVEFSKKALVLQPTEGLYFDVEKVQW